MSALPTCYRHPNRETGLSCSECGRPICTECVTYAPVGLRCPDHSGKPQGAKRIAAAVRARDDDLVTRILIGINVVVFLLEIGTGGSIQNFFGSTLAADWSVDGYHVARGEWWRLLTAGFIHYGFFHIIVNMYSLYLIGGSLERIMGRGRYLLLYLCSLLAGSAGAVLISWCHSTAGASGAIFGLLGAALVLERQKVITAPNLMGIVLINVVLTFTFSNYISVGGHIGGLVGGALTALAYSRFGRGHALYGRLGAVGIIGVVVVGVGSVALAEYAARHLFWCVNF
jgi:membrane associated rhomboid family serine protease